TATVTRSVFPPTISPRSSPEEPCGTIPTVNLGQATALRPSRSRWTQNVADGGRGQKPLIDPSGHAWISRAFEAVRGGGRNGEVLARVDNQRHGEFSLAKRAGRCGRRRRPRLTKVPQATILCNAKLVGRDNPCPQGPAMTSEAFAGRE